MIATQVIRLAAVLMAASAATAARAATSETVLFSFPAQGINASGALPMAGLIAGPDGNLYGTTSQGGNSNCSCGTIFQLAPPAPGQSAWTETVLYSFQGYPNDGQQPRASLVFDKQGNLYGTTLLGGASQSGTVFMVQNSGNGNWTETVLHAFEGTDGQLPYGTLAFDANSNLYGTTSLGGSAGQGTLFEMQVAGVNSPLTVLHNFAGGADGGQSYSGIAFDSQGNLYGTTSSDGRTDAVGGTVFQFAPDGTETVLHRFSDIVDRCCRKGGGLLKQDGGLPSGSLTFDAAGNLYGTTIFGCTSAGGGTVFKLAPPLPGQSEWTETLPTCFVGDSNLSPVPDGFAPMGGVLIDAAGNLYGTTVGGGASDSGAVYKLAPPAPGKKKWKKTLLVSFDETNGSGPFGSLIADTQGNLYGTTVSGTNLGPNAKQIGTVFRVTP